MKKLLTSVVSLVCFSIVTACDAGRPQADTPIAGVNSIYVNAQVYTVDESRPWAEAFAVDDGRFVKIGSNDEVRTLAGDDTEVIDLDGRFVMPGIYDTHIHPIDTARQRVTLNFDSNDSWDVVTANIKAYATANPDLEVLSGGTLNWLGDDGGPIAGTDVPSHRSSLDVIVADRPLIIWDTGFHSILVNSKALEVAGIDKDTVAPDGGVIGRDDDGSPNGVFREDATELFRSLSTGESGPSADVVFRDGLAPFLQELSGYGIVALASAGGRRPDSDSTSYDMLADLARNGRLPLIYSYHSSASGRSIDDVVPDLSNIELHPQIPARSIKIILDGSALGQTMFLVDPYENAKEPGYRGVLQVDKETYEQNVLDLDAAGFAIKSHAVGSGAIRTVLDAYEKARAANPDGPRHNVSHASLVHPDDMSRFQELDIVAELSPAFWTPSPIIPAIVEQLGPERALHWPHPIKSLTDAGAVVSYGSDWPVGYSPSPWFALEIMVTRQKPGGSVETWNADEAVDVETGIRILTINGAYSLNLDKERGSIIENKIADFIVLDRNILDIPATTIRETQVQLTVFNGEVVYRSANSYRAGPAH